MSILTKKEKYVNGKICADKRIVDQFSEHIIKLQ